MRGKQGQGLFAKEVPSNYKLLVSIRSRSK